MRFSPFIALLVALATPATCLPEYNSSPVIPTSAPTLKTNTDSEQQHIIQTAVKELQSREHGYFDIQSRTRQTLPSWDLVAQAAGSVHHTCYKEDNSKGYIWGISGEAHPRGSYGKDWYVKVGKDEQIHC
ncbi:hypothetical protein PG988_011110 [Apiospora saccharicola]